MAKQFTFEARFASRLANVVAQVLFETLQGLTKVYRTMFLWDIGKVGEKNPDGLIPTLNLKGGLRAILAMRDEMIFFSVKREFKKLCGCEWRLTDQLQRARKRN